MEYPAIRSTLRDTSTMRSTTKKKREGCRTQAPEDHCQTHTEDDTSTAPVRLKGETVHMKQRKHHRRGPYDPQTLTRAVTHIRLEAANAGKLTALDALAQVYLPLCQQYVTLFCTDERPNKVRAPLFATPLSERWHQVPIQQAACIAQSWRTNPPPPYQAYPNHHLHYHHPATTLTL